MDKPKFYLEILNGKSMAFGIKVYLDANRKHELFSQFTNGNYDNRKDLFKQFVNNENLGLLDFTFEIFLDETCLNMRWAGENTNDGNKGRQDCRDWIWDYNGMRQKILNGDIKGTGGQVINCTNGKNEKL